LAKLIPRRQEYGGARNNCLLLSIAYQLFPGAKGNWQMRMATASEMRKMILEGLVADLAACKSRFNELETEANLSEKSNGKNKLKQQNETIN
jgi:hypothetical protein